MKTKDKLYAEDVLKAFLPKNAKVVEHMVIPTETREEYEKNRLAKGLEI